MKNALVPIVCATVWLATSRPAPSEPANINTSLPELAAQAVSTNAVLAAQAIAGLRAAGPAGLEALLAANERELARQADSAPAATRAVGADQWLRLCAALDQVGGQYDCQASHLFWYTDFDQARAAARAASKPILSLRLLGRLDEDCSCANSRFFRTTLYANEQISRYLRDHFILYWKSVRPVPRITIDFGDGRRIERTITGNSIHYVLDCDGHVIDALPGLYASTPFLTALRGAEAEARDFASGKSPDRTIHLRKYHSRLAAESRAALARDLSLIPKEPGVEPAPEISARHSIEQTMLGAVADSSDSTWSKIAALHVSDAVLDQGAMRLIKSKVPSASLAGARTASKIAVENPFLRMLRRLRASIAEDTVRNEYGLHTVIHSWLAEPGSSANLDQLNSRIYAELFLTPESDPWLGLAPADAFSGLDGDGLLYSAR